MSAIPNLPLIVERLGWTIVHSLWQFALIAILASAAVRLLRASSANLRYGLLGMAMTALVVVPAITWAWLPAPAPQSAASFAVPESERRLDVASSPVFDDSKAKSPPILTRELPARAPGSAVADSRNAPETPRRLPASPGVEPLKLSWTEQATNFVRPWLAWIVAAWSFGVALCSLRPLLGWRMLRRLRRMGASPVSDDVQAVMRRVSERLGLRRTVDVLHSTLARTPVMVGYLRPVILLPVSLVTTMPLAQLEAILAHELAHVRRHDFLANLLQSLVETLFYYHPAVWWLSHRMRAERENCCDDLVVDVLGDRVAYGRALLAVEELRGHGSLFAMGAADGSLLARVRRIAGFPAVSEGVSPWPALSFVGCGLCLALTMSILAWQSLAASPSEFNNRLSATAPTSQIAVASSPADLPPARPSQKAETPTLLGDDQEWPPRDSASLLKQLHLRDEEFNGRSVQVEQSWTEHVDPQSVLAGEQAGDKQGQPGPPPPASDEAPAPYDQPHRVRFLMTVWNPQLAFDNSADLALMLHPRYAGALEARRWPELPPIAWNTSMMETRMFLEQDRNLKRNSMEWALGYGFASWIDTIDSMEESEGGRLVIKGKPREQLKYGFTREERARTGPPKDRFEIELDSDWIVRRAVFDIAAEPARFTRWGFEADRYRRFEVETSGTVRPPNAPPTAAQGRYQVLIEDPKKVERVLHDETSRFLEISDKLTELELKKRLAADRQVTVFSNKLEDQQKSNAPSDTTRVVAQLSNAPREESEWGGVANGLRARVIPVLSSMSEDAIDPSKRVNRFAAPEDVAFVVEIENTSDATIQLLDTRHGDSFGDSSGKANSNWYGQFLFSIDWYSSDGKSIELPEVQIVDLNSVLDGALVTSLDPGKTHRFLLRPAKWLSPLAYRLTPGEYHAAVRYHGLPARVATRIKEYRPGSAVLAAAAGEVVTPQVALEVQAGLSPDNTDAESDPKTVNAARPALVWGEPSNGLRAALEFTPQQSSYSHGQKPDLKLHVQNVSDHPITLASHLWFSADVLRAAVANEQGEKIEVGDTWYSGWTLTSRIALKPQQMVIYDAGNVGVARTKEQAGKFDDMTNRTLAAPAGEYTMQLEGRFGDSFFLKDGKGKVLAPLAGDWRGVLKTGAAPLTITNELLVCDIVDAVTGEPVVGTLVNFRFIKPKSGNVAEEIVSDMYWGPKAPSRIYFAIPDEVMQRPDREQIELQWGVSHHPEYEPLAPAERIPLKPFFTSDLSYFGDVLRTIKLTPKRQTLKFREPSFVLPDHLNVMAVGFAEDGKELVSVATQSAVAIRTWELEGRKLKREVQLDSDKHGNFFLSSQMMLSGDRRRMIAIVDGNVGIWDTATGRLIKTLKRPKERQYDSLRGLACTPDLSLVACGWSSGLSGFGPVPAGAMVWDVASGAVLATVQHDGAIQTTSVALSADGKWLATGGQQAGTCIWEVSTGELLHALPNDNADRQHPDADVTQSGAAQVVCLQFSPDKKQLAIGDMLGVKLVDAKTGELLHRLDSPFRFGRSGLVYSKDSQLLARVATDKVVPIWSTTSGELLYELQGEAHDGAFSDDRLWFATGFSDETHGVAVWQVARAPVEANTGVSSAAKNRADATPAKPKLEFRFAANLADAEVEPRVPAGFKRQDYHESAVAGGPASKFHWFKFAKSNNDTSSLPVEAVSADGGRIALLANTPDHALLEDGKWSIEECQVVPEAGSEERFRIQIKLDKAGGDKLLRLTQSHMNQALAIVVNGEIISAPRVISEIGRDFVITGNFNQQQAKKLAEAIKPQRSPAAKGDQ